MDDTKLETLSTLTNSKKKHVFAIEGWFGIY